MGAFGYTNDAIACAIAIHKELPSLTFDTGDASARTQKVRPDWYREQNQHVPRVALEKQNLDYFYQKISAGNAARLVTLHGFGGMGKARLVMEWCIEAASLFRGRI